MNGHSREFLRMLEQRDISYLKTLKALGDSLVVRNSGVVPQVEEPFRTKYAFDLVSAIGTPEAEAKKMTLREIREQDDIIGSARAYGIIGAESMTRDQLEYQIAQRREIVRTGEGINTLPSALDDSAVLALNLFLSGLPDELKILGILGVSTVKETQNLYNNFAERFAFMGDSVARRERTRESDRWLSTVLETMVAGLDLEPEQRETARGVAGAIGMMPAAVMTWQMLGLAGGIGTASTLGRVITPIGRAMVRGGLTNTILQDPTAPLNEQAINTGLGALFGLGDLGGVLGRTMSGAGIGAFLGALADDGDLRTMGIAAGIGAAAGLVSGGLTRNVRRSFPSNILQRAEDQRLLGTGYPELSDIPEAEWSPLNAGNELNRGPFQQPPIPQRGMLPPARPSEVYYSPTGAPREMFSLEDIENFNRGYFGGTGRGFESTSDFLFDLQRQQSIEAGIASPTRYYPDQGFGEFDPPVYRGEPPSPAPRGGSYAAQLAYDRAQLASLREDVGWVYQGDVVAPRSSLARHKLIVDNHEAMREGAALTKQTTIVESPAFADLNGNAVLDDSDVALAVVQSYPGQIGVVQNIGDEAAVVRRILMEQMPTGVGPQDFRVVKRSIPTVRLWRGQSRTLPEEWIAQFSDERKALVGRFFSADPQVALGFGNIPGLGLRGYGLPEGQVLSVDIPADLDARLAAESIHRDISERVLPAEFAQAAIPAADIPMSIIAKADLPMAGTPIEQTDILVSSGRPISNKTVREYEKYGMFSGQRVRYANSDVVIEDMTETHSTVRPLYGGEPVIVDNRDLMPHKASHVVDDIPGMYENFQDYARVRLDEQSRQAMMMPVDMFSNEGATQVPILMDEYIKGMGIDPKGYYGATLRNLLETQHIKALKNLVPPDEIAFVKSMQQDYAQMVNEAGGLPPAPIEDLASARGMGWIPGRGASGTLVDAFTKGDVGANFESEDAAKMFLRSFMREPIDDSPVGPFPLEAIETPPGYSMDGGRTPGAFRDADHFADGADDAVRRIEGGGVGEPPEPPSGDSDPWNEAFGRNEPEFYISAFAKLNGLVSKAYLPVRNLAIRLDSVLKPFGIPPFERMFVALQDAHTRMRNEAYQWEKPAFNILHNIRREYRRNGVLWSVLNSPPDIQPTYMDAFEFSPVERQSVADLQQIFRRFHAEEALTDFPEMGYLENYITWFQKFEEALPGQHRVNPRSVEWVPQHPRGEVDWAVEKNVDAIIGRYFSSFYKQRHMNAPYEMIKNSVRGEHVPDVVKDLVGHWADFKMWGADPSRDIIINATHGMLNTLFKPFGLRISNSEVSGLFHAEMQASYAAGLGARPDALIRDLPQALMGVVRVGLDKGGPILHRLFTDKAYREYAMELAYEAGWSQRGHGLAIDPDLFSGAHFLQREAGQGRSITQLEPVARAVDFISDKILHRMGFDKGWQGTWADPLRAYGWQSDWARVWNGITGYETALSALGKYADNVTEFGQQVADDMLLNESRVARYQGTIQDGFLEFAQHGDLEGAARYFGRHVADSQNRFGMAEHPELWRNLGPVTGRKAMKWLTFNSQVLADFAQTIADPRISLLNKFAYFGQIGGLQVIYGIGQALSGWNLMRMSLLGAAYGLAGTSIFDVVNDVQRGFAWLASHDITNPNLTPDQAALIAAGGNQYGSEFFTLNPERATWNPWAGGIRTLGNIAESVPWGEEAVARTIVTGQSGDPEVERRAYGRLPFYNTTPGGSF